MKTMILLVLLAFYSIVSLGQSVYYVQDKAYNANASDMNPGTDINYPWATWQRAFNTAQAGDTVYFRGGTWYLGPNEYVFHDPPSSHGYNGTHDQPICFFNYPGEEPILDAIGHTNTIDATSFDIRFSTNLKFRGLTIRNQKQNTPNQWIASMQFYKNGNIYLDRITCHSGGGYGIWVVGFDTMYITNCDSYNHFDSYGDDPGNRADGITIGSGTYYPDSTNLFVMYGCRSWNNADDAFEISPSCQLDVHDNWSFNNGRGNGQGNGYKLTACGVIKLTNKRKLYNNLIVYNKGDGVDEVNLLLADRGPVMEYSNNTVYKCRIGFTSSAHAFNCADGFARTIHRNNLIYASYWSSFYDQTYFACCLGYPTYVSGHHNTWRFKAESPYWIYNDTVNWSYKGHDADFVLLDSATVINQLLASRKKDGSLPDITALKLKEGSILVDAGIDIGFAFNGQAPDIGAFECGTVPGTSNKYPSVVITYPLNYSSVENFNNIITAEASDADGSISKVEFYYDNMIKIGEANTYPWSCSWNNAPIGKHTLRAIATDNQNAKATSLRLNVTIYPGGLKNTNDNILFPNPNNGSFSFFLASPLKRTSNVSIISFDGKMICNETISAEERIKQFNLPYLSPGIYLFMLYSTEIIFTKLFIKE